MNEFKKSKIKYIARLLNGDRGENYPSGNDFVDNGIPFINTFDLLNTYIDITNANRITDDRYKRLRGLKLQKNDITRGAS